MPRRSEPAAAAARPEAADAAALKAALLEELKKTKKFFYGTVIAQAQKIEIEGDRLVLAFAPGQGALRVQLEQSRPWLEEVVTRLAGRKITVGGVEGPGPAPGKAAAAARGAADGDAQSALKQKAMADTGVQAMLDVFRTDIKEVEEMRSRIRVQGRVGSEITDSRPAEPLDLERRMNIQQMMKQAQQMQDRLQKQMSELRVEATAGGGMVTVVMNGAKQLQSLKLDPEAVSKDDVEMLQDLIMAAINDAQRKADEAMQQQMGGMMGGLKIPGMF